MKHHSSGSVAAIETPMMGDGLPAKWIGAILLLAGVAFAIRILLLFGGMDQASIEFNDGASYAKVGSSIVAGKGISDWHGPHTMWPPFYPFLIAGTSLVAPDAEMAGRLVSLLASLVAVLFAYLIARRLFSREAAAFTALMLAFDPALGRASLAVLGESTYIFAMLGAMWLSLTAFEGKAFRRLLGAGLLIGCAYLTRPEGVLLLGIIGAPFVVGQALASRSWSQVSIGVAGLVLGFMILALPYVVFLHTHTGKWELSGKSDYNWAYTDPRLGGTEEEKSFGLSEDGMTIGMERLKKEEVLKYWSDHKIDFAKRYAFGLVDEYKGWLPQLLHPIMFVLIGIGLYCGQLMSKSWQKLILAGGLLPMLLYPIFHIQMRYLYQFVPLFLIWAGHGAAIVTARLRQENASIAGLGIRVPFAELVLVGFVTLLGVFYVGFVHHPFQVGPEEKRVGQWIEENHGPGARVMDIYTIAAYHADGYPLGIPYAPLNRVLERAQRQRADFLVVGEGDPVHSEVKALLTDLDAPTGLEKVYEFDPAAEKGAKRKFVVYRVLPK